MCITYYYGWHVVCFFDISFHDLNQMHKTSSVCRKQIIALYWLHWHYIDCSLLIVPYWQFPNDRFPLIVLQWSFYADRFVHWSFTNDRSTLIVLHWSFRIDCMKERKSSSLTLWCCYEWLRIHSNSPIYPRV